MAASNRAHVSSGSHNVKAPNIQMVQAAEGHLNRRLLGSMRRMIAALPDGKGFRG